MLEQICTERITKKKKRKGESNASLRDVEKM